MKVKENILLTGKQVVNHHRGLQFHLKNHLQQKIILEGLKKLPNFHLNDPSPLLGN